MANTALSAPLHLDTYRAARRPSQFQEPQEPHAAPQQQVAPRPQRAPMRLTRRGKFVLIGMPIFLASVSVLMLLGLLLSPANASGETPLGVEAVSVTVIEGDTLWGLARDFAPQLDPREAVRQIAEINNLESSTLYAGTELYIPTAQ